MKRILVIGCCGAGKSILSQKLGERLGLPVVHLDRLFWLPAWRERPPEEFDALLETELARDRWIIDGNYGRTLSRRLVFADTVIFLQYPRLCCLSSVLLRWLRYCGKSRPDLGETGCPEKLDLPFLRYVWNYERDTLPKMEKYLAGRPESCRLIRLRSRREADRFPGRPEEPLPESG